MDLISKIANQKPTVLGVLNKHLNEIRQILAEGYTKKSIFELLKKESLIKCQWCPVRKLHEKI